MLTYICIHILLDGLREMDNTDSKMSGETPQNVITAAMTSNTKSEVLSTDPGSYTAYVYRNYTLY